MTDDEREPTPEPTEDAVQPEPEAPTDTDTGADGPEASAASSPRPGEAWDDVLARVSDLGDAIGRWAKTAKDDPENRRRLDEVKAGMNDMARQAQTTFESIDESELGKTVRQGAEETGRALGDAAQKVSDAAAPHVAVIFAGLADAFGKAAAGVDEQAKRARASASAEPGPESDADPAEPKKGD